MGAYWTAHGTKILGGLTAALGVLAGATPTQYHMYGISAQTSLAIATAASGVLTVIRGFVNSAALAAAAAAAAAAPDDHENP